MQTGLALPGLLLATAPKRCHCAKRYETLGPPPGPQGNRKTPPSRGGAFLATAPCVVVPNSSRTAQAQWPGLTNQEIRLIPLDCSRI